VVQFENCRPSAAKAAMNYDAYGTAEAVPFQSRFKLYCYPNPHGSASGAEEALHWQQWD
jgi:hypothetical protein